MDIAIHVYKDKLKDALSLVPNMSPEKKVEAVAYWNDLAEQLQEMVHVDNPSFGQQSAIGQGSIVTTSSENMAIYTTNSSENRVIDINANLMQNCHVEPGLNSPSMKHAITMSHFPQTGIMDDKNLFPYLSHKSPIDDFSKKHSPDSTTQNIVSQTIEATNPYATTEVYSPSLGAPICMSSLDNTPLQSEQSYPPTKMNHLQSTICNLNIEDREPQATSNWDSYDNNQINHNQLITYLGMTNNELEISDNNIARGIAYETTLGTQGLNCPRMTANMISDIGNGQFDRGPASPSKGLNFGRYCPSPTTLVVTSPTIQESTMQTRDHYATSRDKPLQQIQICGANMIQCNNQDDYISANKSRCSLNELPGQSLLNDSWKMLNNQSSKGSIQQDNGKTTTLARDYLKDKLTEVEINKLASNTNNQHTCLVCGKSGFSTKGNLKRHLRAHTGEKPFKCEYCDSCFTEKKSLKIHVRRHTGEKPYKCEICGKLFSQTGVLQSHMALHLNERKFDCHRCGKAFRQRSQLKLHLMRHDGVKRLECTTCFAKFLTKGDLERHCRIHTGERPYCCSTCGKTFTRQQSLNEHMNRHTGRKPYDCKYCDKTFSEMSACYKHAKTHKKPEEVVQKEQISS